MKTSIAATVLVAGLSLGMGSTAVLAISTGTALAAPGDHGQGQGGTRSAAKGANGGGHANGQSNGNGKPENPGWQGRTKVASQLKNLNAVCANKNAWDHAAAGSNIGLMKAYKVAYQEAVSLRTQADKTASHLEATYSGLSLSGLDAADVIGLSNNLEPDLWTADSPDYLAALDAATTVKESDLTQDEMDQILKDHNDAAQKEYQQEVVDLQNYAALLVNLAEAEVTETTTLNAATHGRGLEEGLALTTFQNALLNGC